MTTQPQEQPASGWNTKFPGSDQLPTTAPERPAEPTNEQIRDQEAALHALQAANHVLATSSPVVVPRRPNPNRVKDSETWQGNLKKAAIGTGSIALAGAAVGGLIHLGVAAANNVPTSEQGAHQEAPKTTLDKINDTGRDLANGVITILAKPGSGAEAYGGESIGNKSAVVGPDGKSGTKDDLTKAPESTISYDAVNNSIYVLSAQEYPEQKESSFSTVWVSIQLEADNPITLVKGQPKLEDFKQALAEENPVDVTDLKAKLHVYGKQPGQSVVFTEENGVPHIVVDESVDGEAGSVTETSQGDKNFDAIANRLTQVAQATIQDLTK